MESTISCENLLDDAGRCVGKHTPLSTFAMLYDTNLSLIQSVDSKNFLHTWIFSESLKGDSSVCYHLLAWLAAELHVVSGLK